MKEIIYTFSAHGGYTSDETAVFGEDTRLQLLVQPHDFELKLSDRVLRSSCCGEYRIVVSCKGEACFYDAKNQLIAKAEETEAQYPQVMLKWEQDLLTLSFGRWVTVDYYPNCDGESDRWGTKWSSLHTVKLNLKNNAVETE